MYISNTFLRLHVCIQFLPPLSPIPPLQQCYKGQTLKCSPINRFEKSTQALRTKFAGVQSMYILNFHHSTFSPALQEYSFLPIIQSTQHFLIWVTEELYDEIPSPLPHFLPSYLPPSPCSFLLGIFPFACVTLSMISLLIPVLRFLLFVHFSR